METHNLMELIAGLSTEQQAAVEEFIKYLKEQRSRTSRADFREALDKFVREHSELLERLAR